jgi:class 3 adenylate cyclase
MSDERIDRKIAVIFATDVVGYSKSMEADEAQTIKNLRACRTLLNKSLTKYDGRIFNTAGDSILADFSSAVEALECAAEFQANLKKRNELSEAAKQMEFRIGINMGDVVKEDGNLYGDGVNIAARLEALAQPNGISISKPVYDLRQGQDWIVFNDLGIQQVKRNSFHVYDVMLDGLPKRSLQKPLFSRQPMIRSNHLFTGNLHRCILANTA